MTNGLKIAGAMILMVLCATTLAPAQETESTDIAPGFKMRTTGGLDIGDVYAEVVHFDGNWTETEQHDVFKPATPAAPSTQPSVHVLTGDYPLDSGSFTLTENVASADGGVNFSATMSSPKAITTNEMSVAMTFPVEKFSGKQVMVDGQPFALPAAPAKQGEAHLFDKQGVHEIDLPTPAGTLVITGNLDFLIQDNREWGDPMYALRIMFSPEKGDIKDSKVEFKMKLKPAAGN